MLPRAGEFTCSDVSSGLGSPGGRGIQVSMLSRHRTSKPWLQRTALRLLKRYVEQVRVSDCLMHPGNGYGCRGGRRQ
jgi:hypothetical protein